MILIGWAAPANASCEQALELAAGIGNEVTAAVGNSSFSDAQRTQEFLRIVKANVDAPRLGMALLGQYRDKLAQAEYAEYFSLIERMVVAIMASRLKDSAGEQYSVEPVRCSPWRGADDRYLVSSRVLDTGGAEVTTADWFIMPASSGELKVIDISIAQVSMLTTNRDDFQGYIIRNGRQLGPLLDHLRQAYGG